MNMLTNHSWVKIFFKSLSVISILLTGCVAPFSANTSVDLPDQFQNSPHTTEEDKILLDEQQLIKWWEQFNDPILTYLIEYTLTNNKDIAIAITRVEQAKAVEKGARATLLPQATVNTGVQRHSGMAVGTGTTQINHWQTDLQTSWEIDLFGAGRQRLMAAREQTNATLADVQAIKLSLVAAVAELYMDYRGLQQKHQLLQESLQQAEEFLSIAQYSFTHGYGQQTDIYMAQAEIAQVQAQIRQTNTQIELLRLNLENISMMQPNALQPLLARKQPLPHIPTTISKGQPIDLLIRRPDILAAQARLRSALTQGNAARLDYLPKLTLSGLFGFGSTAIGGVSQGSNSLWSTGLGAAMTLFDFGTRQAQVELWDARSQEAVLAYQKSAIDALFDVENAMLQLSRDQETITLLQTQIKQREKVRKQVYRQFELGAVGRIDVAQARIALLESQMALLAQNVIQLQTQIALFRALGGGWEIKLNET